MQMIVSYINKVLNGVKAQYSYIKNVALSLKIATKKLLHYFKEYMIKVVLKYPLRITLRKLYLFICKEFKVKYVTQRAS